jgi:hypothetical protein
MTGLLYTKEGRHGSPVRPLTAASGATIGAVALAGNRARSDTPRVSETLTCSAQVVSRSGETPQEQRRRRDTPLVVLAELAPEVAKEMTRHWQREGAVVYQTSSALGCLRVATAVGPDVIVLGPSAPTWLAERLHAHPVSRSATIRHQAATVLA